MVRGVSKHAWNKAPALCSDTQTPLPDGYCTYAMAKQGDCSATSKHHALSCQNRALAWKLPQISLFSPSQWCQASSIPKSIFSLTSQHHRVTHKPAVPPGWGQEAKRSCHKPASLMALCEVGRQNEAECTNRRKKSSQRP